MTESPLPSWEECLERVEAGEATALQTFIYHHEPADIGLTDAHTAQDFREQLAAVIAEART